MESIIEHKFAEEDVFFVYPQGEEGKFFPDMLVKVSEGQEAYFSEGGKIIKDLRTGHNSITESFSGFVLFLNKKKFQKKWGTLEPVPFKDKEHSLIYLKAYGTVEFYIENGKNFIEKIILEKKFFITEEFTDFLRNLIFYEFSNVLKKEKEIIKENLENLMKNNLNLFFNNLGLKILNFEIKGGNFIEKEKKEEFTESTFCKKCKKEIPLKANFCPFCGDKISNICPSCKKETPSFAKFCPFCGNKL